MGRIKCLKNRLAVLGAALACIAGAPVQALDFVDVIPAGYAAGFDVATPDPDLLMSNDPAHFLGASPNPAAGAAISFSVTNCFLWSGVNSCQSSVPLGTQNYSGVATWTVTGINVPVPTDGLLFFIGGLANADYVPLPGAPVAPNYQFGDVELLLGGGVFGGSLVPALAELLLAPAPGYEYSYFGKPVFQVGDSMTFGYRVNTQLAAGTPVFFANVATNATPVPEPGTALLIGAGLVMLARRRSRS